MILIIMITIVMQILIFMNNSNSIVLKPIEQLGNLHRMFQKSRAEMGKHEQLRERCKEEREREREGDGERKRVREKREREREKREREREEREREKRKREREREREIERY